MVRAGSLTSCQEGVKTPHRIELCEEEPVRPTRNYRKRRILPATPTKTENAILKSKSSLKKIEQRSKPLKTSNGIANMTNGHTLRSRAARTAARAAESHKLTEYFKEVKSPKIEPPPSPPPIENTVVKVEPKIMNGANHKLTEYFPVRRSVRKTSKCVMAEKMRDLERAVREQREDGLQVNSRLVNAKQFSFNLERAMREQKEDGLQVAHFEGKGRGVIATRQFGRGQFVVEYAGELVGTAEARERERLYAQDPEKGCYMYYFRHGDQQYCIDATAESGRLGRLVNHSRNGNLSTKAVWVDGPRLVLLAAQDIAPGEELTYDYGDRSKESLQHHPWLAL